MPEFRYISFNDENGFDVVVVNPSIMLFDNLLRVSGSDITYETEENGAVRPVSGTIEKIVQNLPAPEGAHHGGQGDQVTLILDGISVEALNKAKPDWYNWDKTEEGQADLIAFFESFGGSVEVKFDPYNQIIGTDDRDILSGTSNRDDIQGGDGEDVIFGDDNNDTIGGGAGADIIYAGAGDDHIYSDDIHAGLGGDFIYAQDGDDDVIVNMVPTEESGLPNTDFTVVSGGAGNDDISVSGGKSVVDGGDGEDNLTFGGGQHTVWGRGGSDKFQFNGGYDSSSSVLVKDFDVSADLIGSMSFENFQANAKQVGDDVVWTQDDGVNSVTFADLTIADFSADLFLG